MHREKLPSDRNATAVIDRNATAVIDRTIQTLKKDLAGKVARDGGGWAEHVGEVTEAYNARPHQAVTVAPEDVETKPAATFRVLRDNAEKFEHNKNLTGWRRPGPSGPRRTRRGASSRSTGRCGRWRATTR